MNDTIRLLLVDDEMSFLEPLSQHLAAHGIDVMTARSGPEALKKIQRDRAGFEVALVDQSMGPPNGIEVMRKLHEWDPALQVIILTGWGDMTPGAQAMELGAYRYMSKPVGNLEELTLNIRMAARFGAEHRHRTALQALVPAGERIGAATSDEDLYHRLYEETTQLLPKIDGFLIARHNQNTDEVEFPYVCVRGERVEIASRPYRNGIAEFALRRKEPLLLPDGDRKFREDHGLTQPTEGLGYCRSKIVVPLLPVGQFPETINAFTYHDDVRYTEEQLEVVQAFANQASAAKQSIQQLEEARQLEAASAALARHHSYEDVIEAIVREADRLINSDFTGLILQDEDGTLRKVRPVAPRRFGDRFDEPRQDTGVTRRVVETRQPRIIPNTEADPLVKDAVRDAGIKSMLAMPMIFDDRVVGVLYGHTFEPRHFSDHDVSLWQSFAAQAAAALQRALEEQRAIEDARLLAQHLGILTEKVDLAQTLTRVANAAKELFDADTCRIAHIDPPTGRIILWRWAEGAPKPLRYEADPRPDGTTRYVLEHRTPVFRSNAGSDEQPQAVPELVAEGLRSFASLPLLHDDRVIALLHCNFYRRRQAFAERSQQTLEAFGAYAAMAIDGARRNADLQSWHEFDREVATCQSIAALYRLLTDYARRVLHADVTVFLPCTNDTSTAKPDRSEFVCTTSAISGDRLAALHAELHRWMDEDRRSTVIANTLGDLQAPQVADLLQDTGVKAFIAARLPGKESEPFGPGPNGLLFLGYRQMTAFRSDDLSELERALNYAASNIVQLRLRERFRDLIEQQEQQLRGITEIFGHVRERQGGHAILSKIAQTAHEALGVDVVSVLEYDAMTEQFTERGVAGVRHDATRFSLPDSFKPLFLDKGEPTIIRDAPHDERMRESDFVAREEIRDLVVFPMRVNHDPLGLFFANYRHRRDFTDLETLRLFADLAARVIHEARLQSELNADRQRLDRRLIWDQVSAIATASRHEEVTYASAIRNYTATLERFLDRANISEELRDNCICQIAQIERLAVEISEGPVPVPTSLEPEMVAIAPTIQRIAGRRKWTIAKDRGREIQVTIDLDTLEGVYVLGYRSLLITAIEGLMRNAQSQMRTGGTIAVVGDRLGRWAEIRFRDTGPGVPKAIQGKLFKEPIPKEDADPSSRGWGIGCLLVSFAMDQHDGSVEIEETGPYGTTILVRLPISQDQAM